MSFSIVHSSFMSKKSVNFHFFRGLDSLVRAENYLVKVSLPTHNPQLFTFTFGIPEGRVVYEDHHAVRMNRQNFKKSHK